jgi:hypothetical protein
MIVVSVTSPDAAFAAISPPPSAPLLAIVTSHWTEPSEALSLAR